MKENSLEYSLEKAKNGTPTLSVIDESGSRVYLHSRYDPSREAGVAAETIDPRRYDVLVVLGTGLGYHLKSVLDAIDLYQQVVLVERLDLHDDILRHFFCPPLLNNRKVQLLFAQNPERVIEVLSRILDLANVKGLQVYEHPSSMRAYPGYYDYIRRSLTDLITRKSGNLITRMSLGFKYLKNGLMNLHHLSRVYPLSALRDAFKGMPAIILIPGPSLDRHLPIITRLQQQVYIIAVDSALTSCRAYGIVPDVCVSIDPQSQVHAHTFTWNDSSTMHVCAITAYPMNLRYPRTFVSLNTHPVAQAIDEMYPHTIGSMDSNTGTVAGDAILFADTAGFDPVLVTGLDFSFPDFQTYARDSQYQHTSRIRAHRIATVQTQNLQYIMQSSGGITSEGLHTRKSFLQYRDTIESLITQTGNNIYQAGGPGLSLKSIQRENPVEFIRTHAPSILPKKVHINQVISGIQPLDKIVSMENIRRVLADAAIQKRIIAASLHNPKPGNREKALNLFYNFTQQYTGAEQ